LGEDLIQVLEKCKFVISSAGTSIWDFLVNSRTLAIVKSVENQTRNYKFVVENTLAIGIGEWKDGKWNLDIEKLNNFLTSSPTSPKIDVSKIGLDFMGSERFVDKVLEKFNFFE
jgi:spore coat polysaccharide biosynthesis predicted glycosyltransferase SpsG